MRPETRHSAASRSALHRRFVFAPSLAPGSLSRGLYDGEPESCRRDARQFLSILLHLGLLLAVFKAYRLEGRAFQIVVPLALATLPTHYLLPFRWKKPLFVAASIGGLFWVFGFETASCVVGLAAAFLGLCFAPIAWGLRAATVATLGLALTIARPQVFSLVPENVWPVLASMLVLRMMLFLYELKHAKGPESVLDAVGYFFLLPNYCFLHFPVVDYRTLQRGYFADEVHATMRRGLRMMFRGTLHLIAYRLVCHELLVKPDEVRNVASLAGHLVTNYLLYLRVSGQFHIACGMLHLFGFHLPETHHNYLLASSFTDYWRRINIYWKDFMVRLVFNPVFFRLKRWPRPAALAAATAAVFAATWALHACQWHWIRGTWGLGAPDALFWGILGALVIVNVQLDARRCGSRTSKHLARAPRALAAQGLRIAATFLTIALLWSLWCSPSVGAWMEMLRRGLRVG